ncbi:MAG: DUF932 domain-containing protein, partial [Verrucomicrobia bacterium]|nr:DUF932 domain-containing protein [Verrucomicrobiota bacterium]
VLHRGDALQEIAQWLSFSYAKAQANVELLKQNFKRLAETPVDDPRAKSGFGIVYPLPPAPKKEGPAEIVALRVKKYEEIAARTTRLRCAAFDLFNGAGTGMAHRAANHTAWGFVQAVTELEDYRRGSPIGSKAFRVARECESALFGSRAQAKERAIAEALAMAGLKPYSAALARN